MMSPWCLSKTAVASSCPTAHIWLLFVRRRSAATMFGCWCHAIGRVWRLWQRRCRRRTMPRCLSAATRPSTSVMTARTPRSANGVFFPVIFLLEQSAALHTLVGVLVSLLVFPCCWALQGCRAGYIPECESLATSMLTYKDTAKIMSLLASPNTHDLLLCFSGALLPSLISSVERKSACVCHGC